MNIGLDAMGGDFAPDSTIQGAILAKEVIGNTDKITLVGQKKIILDKLNEFGSDCNDFNIVHAGEIISMGEHPLKAFSRKPHSSIATGFKMLKTKELDSFASAGNSGAMVVGSMYTVNTIRNNKTCTSALIPRNGGVSVYSI